VSSVLSAGLWGCPAVEVEVLPVAVGRLLSREEEEEEEEEGEEGEEELG